MENTNITEATRNATLIAGEIDVNKADLLNPNQKQTVRYTGICYTISDNDAIVESYGSDKAAVLKKTLAAALCYGEPKFSIETSVNKRPVMIEHYTITDATAAQYTATGKEALQ